ncbi:MAG: hypothetical protein WD232_02795 [Acidimicrobiales bacterium]
MGDVVYASKSRIERREGPIRAAFVPGEDEPTLYGVHGEIAEHYGVAEGAFDVHATTLDHVVAAAAG